MKQEANSLDMNAPNPIASAGFNTVSDLLRAHAKAQPSHPAVRDETQAWNYAQLDALVDRIAASLQRDGVRHGDVVAICALNSVRYAALFLGALRAGVVVAPLAPSSTAESLACMLRDAQARHLFLDKAAQDLVPADAGLQCISLDGVAPGRAFEDWLAPEGAQPAAVSVEPEAAFNIIYSSGTTGTPKGIVQSHGMRWTHINRGGVYGYGPEGTTLVATPLYSNTTLVVFFPTLGSGGCVVLMPKFDAARYLQLARLPEAIVAAYPSVREIREIHARVLKPLLAEDATRDRVLAAAADLAARPGEGTLDGAKVLAALRAAAAGEAPAKPALPLFRRVERGNGSGVQR